MNILNLLILFAPLLVFCIAGGRHLYNMDKGFAIRLPAIATCFFAAIHYVMMIMIPGDDRCWVGSPCSA